MLFKNVPCIHLLHAHRDIKDKETAIKITGGLFEELMKYLAAHYLCINSV